LNKRERMSIKNLLIRFTSLYIFAFLIGYAIMLYFDFKDGIYLYLSVYAFSISLSTSTYNEKNKRKFYKNEKKYVVKAFILINLFLQILLYSFIWLYSEISIAKLDFIFDSGFMILIYSVFIYFVCGYSIEIEKEVDDKNIVSD